MKISNKFILSLSILTSHINIHLMFGEHYPTLLFIVIDKENRNLQPFGSLMIKDYINKFFNAN